MGRPENLKFDELIRDAITLLVKRGEIKMPRKKTAALAAKRETRRLVTHESDQGQMR